MFKKTTFLTVAIFFIAVHLHAQFKLSGEIRPRSEYRDGFKVGEEFWMGLDRAVK